MKLCKYNLLNMYKLVINEKIVNHRFSIFLDWQHLLPKGRIDSKSEVSRLLKYCFLFVNNITTYHIKRYKKHCKQNIHYTQQFLYSIKINCDTTDSIAS